MNADHIALPAQPAAQTWKTTSRGAGRRGRLVRRALVTADSLGLFLAFFVTALTFGTGGRQADQLALGAEYLLFLATLPVWALAAKLYELYDRDEERAEHTTLDDAVRVFHLVTVGAWLLYLGAHLTGLADPELPKVAMFWLLAFALVTGGRAAARVYVRRRPEFTQNAIVVGAGEVGQLVGRKLQQHPEYGIRLVGFVDRDPLALRPDLEGQAVLGGPERLPQLVEEHEIERVLVAFSGDSTAEQVDLVRKLKALDVQIDIVPRLFDVVGPNVAVHSLEGLPLVGLPSAKLLPFSRGLKRTVDVVGASLLLLLTAPLFGFIAWRVRRDSPGPIFFRQKRLGEGMREFEVLKFRTMYVDTDESEHREFIRRTMSAQAAPTDNGLYKLERTSAITRSGRWLRKTSLDELPNLVNILRGDMSLVGPRPCLSYETENFAPHHFERFLVPAGLTGLWQVTARAHSTFGEALDMDVAYARNWSLGLDLWLLLRTPLQILRREGTA
jgi:exopolysaccharide biosynthesis polyprenyl glycosylphosphotransferase